MLRKEPLYCSICSGVSPLDPNLSSDFTMKIWEAPELPTEAKLRLYSAGVVAVLTHGYKTWSLDAKALSSLKGWNARCLCRITGRDVADECRHPTIDLPEEPRPRRLRWAGHVLRLDETHLVKRTLLARAEKSAGGPTLLVLIWPRLQPTPRRMSCCSSLQTETGGASMCFESTHAWCPTVVVRRKTDCCAYFSKR